MMMVLAIVAPIMSGLFWADRRAYRRRYEQSTAVHTDDGGSVYVDGDCDDVIDCDDVQDGETLREDRDGSYSSGSDSSADRGDRD
jgi:hypothetical protein